ncbi:uncharacterized protein LOC121835995 [Ixodes scapularis]|uniref:uncharacterized protein LOC121835995 n=1 Tax=Ixodes scapularis TaxID=6945 RepID=UPI001C38D0A9|nr:uncharacterized protein LOC121835995 [Ixodes scapularis]
MRLSCVLCFLAMCHFAYGSGNLNLFGLGCTKTWTIPLLQCMYVCQHGEWGFLRIPRFTVEQTTIGTSCKVGTIISSIKPQAVIQGPVYGS